MKQLLSRPFLRANSSFVVGIGILLSSPTLHAQSCEAIFLEPGDAFIKYLELLNNNRETEVGGQSKSKIEKGFGTDKPIMHAAEKEGLFASEIAAWFPQLRESGQSKLFKLLEEEQKSNSRSRPLTGWLRNVKIDVTKAENLPMTWGWLGPKRRLQYLVKQPNLLEILSEKDREFLFDRELINFDDIQAGSKTPPKITVGDDLGSYEVRHSEAIIDRTEYLKSRAEMEAYLEGKIGHQHIFNAWPKDPSLRERIAPYYIELLDSSTWYLFWRQMNRNPNEVDSIVTHPFLGVYTRESLNRLHHAVVTNRTNRFNDKFRMVGARYFKSRDENADHSEKFLTDWELRSGNKGEKREFIETTVEARLVTGDYTGLKDFRTYDFAPSAPLEKLTEGILNASELNALKWLETSHPMMKYSQAKIAKNHIRNRVISPLLPWEKRLDLSYMMDHYMAAKRAYAKGLVKIANDYKAALGRAKEDKDLVAEAKEDAVDKVEKLIFQFSQSVRLDLALENYLTIRPKTFPEIQIQSQGPVDVNQLPLGIEYSFRFASNLKPQSQAQAQSLVSNFSGMFSSVMGFEAPSPKQLDGHGHGISVKYSVKDQQGDAWRFEWDGIQREYKDGKVERAWGGHAEVVTPKFVPTEVRDQIAPLYEISRRAGMHSSREAGGAHVNFDLKSIREKLGDKKAARAVLNLVSYYESNLEAILFLWQHPGRTHAATPVPIKAGFAEAIQKFNGDWTQLGKLLYEYRYFNPYVGRKPKYVGLNLTAVMSPVVPSAYKDRILDIRNTTREWFPNFNKITDRGEARFFDAPTNEYMAALQIKYFRAILDHALNAKTPLKLAKNYGPSRMDEWLRNPKLWKADISEHLIALKLDPKEFEPLIWESFLIRLKAQARNHDYKIFDQFLPAESGKK